MRGRRVALALVAVGIAALALTGSPAAKEQQPFSFCLGNHISSWTVESTDPLVRDTISFFGTGALVQHSIRVERTFRPETMRGHLSGTISATGPNSHRGTLNGTITPAGMSGTIHMTRFREDGTEDRYIGTWSSVGHPTDFMSSYEFCFEGRYLLG